ncbi:hypothetical protein ACFC09_18200 [Streptomyces sp. NPDC056161]|uniref:hypothetical protein n=1 Tax=Streptomyces sp. NPDC056161 TaxID=3345732 RepID=UPI0035E14B3E
MRAPHPALLGTAPKDADPGALSTVRVAALHRTGARLEHGQLVERPEAHAARLLHRT